MKKLVIDANLLCLLVAGYFVPVAIGRHKRLKAYDSSDFIRVKEIISGFDKIATCPHVLTETSNLLSQTNDHEKGLLLQGLRVMMEEMEEVRPISLFACDHPSYARLGLTDAVLLTMDVAGAPLLTADLDLTVAAQKDGREALNYNWIRDGAYD